MLEKERSIVTPEVDHSADAEMSDLVKRGFMKLADLLPEEQSDEDTHNSENNQEEDQDRERSFSIIPLPDRIIEHYPFIKELPKNIAVMGGTARSIAREIITGDREPIRDIDLVNILDKDGESFNDSETLDSLSREYMADDYVYGHGIEDDNLSHYFSTRDFTVNETLILNGSLILSEQAYDDFQENIIRPTQYEFPDRDWRPPTSRLAMRALMMQTVLEGCTSSYPTVEDMNISETQVHPFEVAVTLNKAMSRGAETACRFTDLLADYNIIPAELAGQPKAAAKYLLKYRLYSFEFRPNGNSDVNVQKQTSDFDSPGPLKVYHASDPSIRAALAEYEDDISTERLEGQYTAEEYADINSQKSDCYNYYYDEDDEDDDYYDDDEDYYDEDKDSSTEVE